MLWRQIDKTASHIKQAFEWKPHAWARCINMRCEVLNCGRHKKPEITQIKSHMNVSWRKLFLKCYVSFFYFLHLFISLLLLILIYFSSYLLLPFLLLFFLHSRLRLLLILNIYVVLLFSLNYSFYSSDSCVHQKLVLYHREPPFRLVICNSTPVAVFDSNNGRCKCPLRIVLWPSQWELWIKPRTSI